MRRETQITLEVEETVVIRQAATMEKRYCPLCDDLTDMAPPHVIALLPDVSEREIFRLIEADVLFSYESDLLRVCLACLENQRRKLCEI